MQSIHTLIPQLPKSAALAVQIIIRISFDQSGSPECVCISANDTQLKQFPLCQGASVNRGRMKMFSVNPSPIVHQPIMRVEQGQVSINYTYYWEQERDYTLTLPQIFILHHAP